MIYRARSKTTRQPAVAGTPGRQRRPGVLITVLVLGLVLVSVAAQASSSDFSRLAAKPASFVKPASGGAAQTARWGRTISGTRPRQARPAGGSVTAGPVSTAQAGGRHWLGVSASGDPRDRRTRRRPPTPQIPRRPSTRLPRPAPRTDSRPSASGPARPARTSSASSTRARGPAATRRSPTRGSRSPITASRLGPPMPPATSTPARRPAAGRSRRHRRLPRRATPHLRRPRSARALRAQPLRESSASFAFSSSEAGSSFQCKLDSGFVGRLRLAAALLGALGRRSQLLG